MHATCPVADGVAFVAGCDGDLRAIRLADGGQVFALTSGGYTGASPALHAGRAYYGTFEDEVLGVDLRSRKVLWRYTHAERRFPFYSSAALGGGLAVVGGRDRMVHALDLATGKPAWTFPTRARVDSSPAIAGGRVYLGSGDRRLYALDLATGKVLESFEAGAGITASPAIAAGRLVVAAVDGQVYCFGRRG